MIAWPFAGVDESRPYPPTGLTTAEWEASVPLEEVALADLWLTQGHLRTRALLGGQLPDRPPYVVAWDGRLHLEDGHHRVVRAHLVGETHVKARVFRRE